MKIIKVVRNSVVIAAFAATTILMTGCGGVSEAQMAELNTLRQEVSSLEEQVNTLTSERGTLERDIAEKNQKLQQCARDKEVTRANLEKLPQ